VDRILRRAEQMQGHSPDRYHPAPLNPDRAGDQSDCFEIAPLERAATFPPRNRLFIKQLNDPRYHEAWHYLALTPAGAPVPVLYGWMSNADGHEVLFLEHLHMGFTDESLSPEDTRYETFIRLIARFNALQPPTRYLAQLPLADLPGILEDAAPALPTLVAHGRRGGLGTDVRRLLTRGPHPDAHLAAQLRALVRRLRAMPIALIHGDLFPRHVGVRADTGDWRVIDLLYTQRGPRLFDLAPFLGAPEDATPLLADRRRELARAYLDSLGPAPNAPRDVGELLAEVEALWLGWEMRCLRRWILSALEEGSNGVYRDSRRWLLQRLVQLAEWQP